MHLLHLYRYILLPCNYEIQHELSTSSMPSSSPDAEDIVKYKRNIHAHTCDCTHMHVHMHLPRVYVLCGGNTVNCKHNR